MSFVLAHGIYSLWGLIFPKHGWKRNCFNFFNLLGKPNIFFLAEKGIIISVLLSKKLHLIVKVGDLFLQKPFSELQMKFFCVDGKSFVFKMAS